MSQSPFLNLAQKISHETQKANSQISINGIGPDQWALLCKIFQDSDLKSPLTDKNIVYFFEDNEKADRFFNNVKDLKSHEVLRFPGQEVMPYLGFIPSERDLVERFYCLSHLANPIKPSIVITVYDSLFLRLPPKSFFKTLMNKIKI
jgi:transcription-repair coupling factor (superfamily II helicase)